MYIAAEQVHGFFFIMVKKKIGILKRISAKMPIDPNSNILFFSKLDEPIR